MTIPLKNWTRGSAIRAADLNRMVEAIRRATPVAGNGISVSQSLGGSVIAVSGRAGAGGVAVSDGGDFPFRIRRVNTGTVETPAWRTAVYVPDGSFTITTWGGVEYIRDADSTSAFPEAGDDWYEYERNDGFGVVALQLALYFDRAATPQAYKCYWRLARKGDSMDSWNPQAGSQYWRGKFEVPVGEVTGTGAGEVYNLVRSAIYVSRVSFYTTGGGGGGAVDMSDERTDTSAEGVVGFTGFAADGTIMLVAKSLMSSDGVGISDTDTTLTEYLAGGVDEPGFGVNVNTENFPDECLGPALTPNEVEGDQEVAAPSVHRHTLDQLVNEDDEAVTGDDLVDFFSNAGLWDSLGETGPSGEGPSENSILTVGDIEDDASYLKRDAAVPDAGDVTTDLLVLSGHRHPLNVADVAMATGPTGEEPMPPPASDYVLAVGVGTTGPSGDEASPRTAAFGIQPFYARVDHIHPICDDMGPTGAGPTGMVGPVGGIGMTESSELDGTFTPTAVPEGIVLDAQSWVPGEMGYTESYCSRIAVRRSGAVVTRYAIFRQRKVSRTGVVVWVGPEYVGFVV